MKLLTNRSGSYLTGDEIADAVLHYGLALAKRKDIDLIDVPFLDDDGRIRRVAMTVGWHADTAAVTSLASVSELLEVDTIVSLYAKADSVGVIHAQAFSDEERDELVRWPSFNPEEFG